jgi:hypothetical protein
MERYFDTALNNHGEPSVGLTVTITDANGNLATLYSDNGVKQIGNPIYTDKNGAFSFYAANGRYSVALTADGVAPQSIKDIILLDPEDQYLGDSLLAGQVSADLTGYKADVASTANGKGADLVANAAKKVAFIASLRALRVPQGSDAQTVILDGYSTAGDGGGGVFQWWPNSPQADDGGIYINPTGNAGNGRWVRADFQIFGPINVRWYGAKGDGANDDAPASQAAINAFSSGATFSFPRGTYKLGSALTYYGHSRFIGDGAENTVITTTAAITMFAAKSATNYVTFEGFTFSLNGSSCVGAVDLSYVTNAIVRDSHFQNLAGFYGFGVKVLSGSTSSLVGYWAQITGNGFNSLDKCIDAPDGDATWGGGNDAYIAFNTFTNQYNYGIYLGLHVSDCYILANDFAGAQYCEIYVGWFGTKISMNKFENNASPLPATHLGYNIVLDTQSGGTLSFFNRSTGTPGLIIDKVSASSTTNTIFETNLTQWPAGNNATVNFGNISIGVDSSKRTIQAASGYNLILKAIGGGATVLDGDGGVIFNKSGTQVGSITTNDLNNNGSHWYRGSGSPNSVVVGNPGDLYTNTSGGAGTTLYVKESGTGTNTGWVGK